MPRVGEESEPGPTWVKCWLGGLGRVCVITPPISISPFLQRGWVLGLNNYYSFASQQQKPEDTTIPSTELAKQVIEYARQLEMIV